MYLRVKTGVCKHHQSAFFVIKDFNSSSPSNRPPFVLFSKSVKKKARSNVFCVTFLVYIALPAGYAEVKKMMPRRVLNVNDY
jgi:hypothetical protein